MPTPRLKVYVYSNLDGENMAMVAAPNLKEAASLMHATVGGMRRYGYRVASDPGEVALATANPGTVYYKPILVIGEAAPWTTSRARWPHRKEEP